MATLIKPPHPLPAPSKTPTLFLAGSIDMGLAEDWQSQVEKSFAQAPIILLNPRRDNWDASWEQRLSHPLFRGQVEWELQGLEQADLILMYFAPQSQAPITLLEFGLFARSGKLRVACPDPFWRKGNIEVVCAQFQIPLYESLDELLATVRTEWGLKSTSNINPL
ncbi:hypothetical protein COW36_17240 [bacterium (Candidatus Blackallbacteria) CG17_big_fil_post_rev_8_21_14_2_50_48_46]|uniref:Nucleoside 2-deoxyribosyltransferase n=1 Tax=bacterium (Candidatus Blackallbacteria) CG17_big_fil_post_rev_8_21_14_2_50_48_46 TaxID=2014261 RepID=A0A2M7G285_9BACT|nr:MAG: hypothetical protein COW64_01490 [bacterium (Candidatus Blackallbacteria) CG18_big_fil_WC_8_21_14_2_50_49_26]PIW15450.1 MAG: hypothetical protein COW36_17240 [bacterium (Candidatus Blackallbacteria) CG17_big_fil_post_rev_8_21_14_2_50_48_46]PIW50173.1 MAG: hypothetical protein COW20_03530 [bacterium (Candidatus Blackallbacteria) CG13_big_fil_rev_8_21_14_2_50_49_14]